MLLPLLYVHNCKYSNSNTQKNNHYRCNHTSSYGTRRYLRRPWEIENENILIIIQEIQPYNNCTLFHLKILSIYSRRDILSWQLFMVAKYPLFQWNALLQKSWGFECYSAVFIRAYTGVQGILLPVSPSQNHSSREEHPERRTPPIK